MQFIELLRANWQLFLNLVSLSRPTKRAGFLKSSHQPNTMNPAILTTRPELSTNVVTANPQANSRMLDKLLASHKGSILSRIPSVLNLSSEWLSQSSYMGLDDRKNPMYSPTRGEIMLVTTWAIASVTALGLFVSWLF